MRTTAAMTRTKVFTTATLRSPAARKCLNISAPTRHKRSESEPNPRRRVKGAGGTINAVHGGSKLASEQLRDATLNGTAPTSRLERFGVAAGATAANVAWAATKDIGARLGGRPNHGGGSMGGRMGDAMRSQAADKNAARERPSSPSSAATGTDGGTIRGATSDGNSK